MFTALLLSVLAAGSPAAGIRVVQSDDPAVQLWISNDRRFYQTDRATVQIRARDDGYVLVLHADPDGHVRVLAPLDPNDDNFVRGGRKYDVKGRNARESFTIEVSSGRGTVYAAYSAAPFRFEAYTLGDHWDYRALAPNILPTNPESELTEIVRSMATASFDYDILNYDVLGQAYANNSSYESSGYYDGYYGSSWCCGFSFGLSFGYPHYHYPYYGYGYYPYNYAYYPGYPYYWPASYYPYRPYYGYYRPYHPYYPYYGWGGYRPGWGNGYVTPYRYRGNTVIAGDYRPYTLRRTVNTPYNSPAGRASLAGTGYSPRRTVGRSDIAPVNTSDRRQVARSGASDGREVTGRRSTQTPWPEQVGPGARRSVQRGQSAPTASRSNPTATADRGEPSVNRREIVARRSIDRPGAGGGSVGSGMSDHAGPDARRSIDREAMSAGGARQIDARPARSEPVRAADPRSSAPDMGGRRSVDRGPSGNTSRGSDAGPRPSGGGSSYSGGGGGGGRAAPSSGGGSRGGGMTGGGGGGMRRR